MRYFFRTPEMDTDKDSKGQKFTSIAFSPRLGKLIDERCKIIGWNRNRYINAILEKWVIGGTLPVTDEESFILATKKHTNAYAYTEGAYANIKFADREVFFYHDAIEDIISGEPIDPETFEKDFDTLPYGMDDLTDEQIATVKTALDEYRKPVHPMAKVRKKKNDQLQVAEDQQSYKGPELLPDTVPSPKAKARKQAKRPAKKAQKETG